MTGIPNPLYSQDSDDSVASNAVDPVSATPPGNGQEITDFWHQPLSQNIYLAKSQWFIPYNAGAAPALAPAETSRTPTLPEAVPTLDGGWYRPPYALEFEAPAALPETFEQEFDLRPAETLELDEIGLPPVEAEIQPALEFDDIDLDADFAEPPSLEGVEAFREAPSALDFAAIQPAPELPLSAQLEAGLGGLRDIERMAEETPSLRPEDISKERDTAELAAPDQGLGGLRDQVIPTRTGEPLMSTPPNPNVTMPLGEQSQATPVPTATGAFAPVPPAPVPASSTPPPPSRFKEVEKQVETLRHQFRQGLITRAQLEGELRRLMVLDDAGRWWTLGVDSNRWYRYNGREWLPDTPPEPVAPLAAQAGLVRGNIVRTETNVPMPAAGTPAPQAAPVMLDDYGMPLPQRVPENDPGATLVNIKAAMAGSSPSDAQTLLNVSSPAETVVHGLPSMEGQSMSYDEAAEAALAGATLESEGVIDAARAKPGMSEEEKPKSLQPDYSAAFSGFDRRRLVKYGIWASVLAVVFGLGVVLIILLGTIGYYYYIVNQYRDELDALGGRTAGFQNAILYDANGNQLAEFTSRQGDRTIVTLDQISPFLIHATVAAEDETYYENPGFSFFQILRAIYTNILGSGPRSGASTITQQLVKQVILEEDLATEVSVNRKITEIILASELTERYNKSRILEIYLNEIYYGNFSYGIEAAAQNYFGKPASQLDPFESAFLAGLPQNANLWDPVSNREGIFQFRYPDILRLMTEANGDGCIQMQHQFTQPLVMPTSNTTLSFDLSRPLCIIDNSSPTAPGLDQGYVNLANYPIERAVVETKIFNPQRIDRRYQHFVQWIWEQEVLTKFDEEEIFRNGYKIYTTLIPAIQNEAQQAIIEQDALISANNGSVVVMNPQTGAVLAMVGSVDFDNEAIDGQVNIAFSPQQPGSSIKPVVYLAALEGSNNTYWTPGTVIWDVPICYRSPGSPDYCPNNFNGRFNGPITMRNALARSLNIPAIKALEYITPDRLVQKANALGITFRTTEPPNLTWAVGGGEVYLFDMVKGYSAFANGGFKILPYGVTRIENKDGEIIYQAVVNPEREQVMTAQHAYMINAMLSDNAARIPAFGANNPLEVPGRIAAVKSGTSNDVRDIWTIGWTPNVIVGVWMGNTDNSIWDRNAGSTFASRVWNRVIQKSFELIIPGNFDQPADIASIPICNDTGAQRPSEGCGVGGEYFEIFWNQQPPSDSGSSGFQLISVDRFTGLRANEFCPEFTEQRSFLDTTDQSVIQWLNTDPQGQQWAAARNLQLPVTAAPEGECDATYVRPIAQVGSPLQSAVVQGTVDIIGSINLPNFDRYELLIAPAGTDQFKTINRSTLAVQNDNLGAWNSQFDQTTGTAFPNGAYVLRLTAFTRNGESLSTDVPLVLNNPTSAPPQ